MSESDKGAALLALSPDDVFVSRGVSEVIELHKKIQYEIERKREDLRAMVGERYRELIHAADTIGDMKLTTEKTLEHLGGTVALCRNLHDTHLIGFKIQQKVDYVDRNDTRVTVHSIAVQVKLLLDIPEKVWCCIDNEDSLQATKLYLLARHIHTGLQIQASNKTVEKAATSLKPLLERQWISLSNLHYVLENACKQKLQEVELSSQTASSCLLSLHLLSPQSSLLQLLHTLIEVHSSRGLAARLEGGEGGGAGERIASSVGLVARTLQLVQACFVDGNEDSVISRLEELYSKDSNPLIKLIQFQEPHLLKLLPPVISEYRLTASKEIKSITREEVSKAIADWIQTLRDYIHDKVKLILAGINHVKTLQKIREDALSIETPQNWKEICESLSMAPIDVWSEYFQPLLTSRVKEIIEIKWKSVLENFKTQMMEDLTRVASNNCKESDSDLNWYAWKDLIGDTVIETRESVVEVMNSLMRGMSHQDRGFTPTLEKMCQSIDAQLGKLLKDLSTYLHRKPVDRSVYADSVEDSADRNEIQVYLRDITSKNIASMLQYLKEDCFDNPNLKKTDLQLRTTSIYTARFIQSLMLLLPSLKKCYSHADDKSTYIDPYSLKDDEGMAKWNEICGVLKENCLYCWGRWVDIAAVEIEALREGLPQKFTLEANIDFLLMQWDVIQIQEKDDQENSVESTIKIPSGPSLKLQQFLYSSSRILDQIVPHTLPKEVHSSFIERLYSITLTHYDKVIRENETEINQKCALQLLVDVRHATLLLVPRENKAYIDLSDSMCEVLRSKIDPFDYDVFHPYIQTNIKKSVQRVQTLLGDIIGSPDQVSRQLGSAPLGSGGSADKSPAILATPPPRDWLTLLPITAPVLRRDKRKKAPAVVPSPVTSAAVKSTASDLSELMSTSLSGAKQGAAAFFGDWFSS